MIYLNSLFRLSVAIESPSTFRLFEHFQELISTIGFKQMPHLSNGYIRVNEGNIFEHVAIHLVPEDDFIVHLYAK